MFCSGWRGPLQPDLGADKHRKSHEVPASTPSRPPAPPARHAAGAPSAGAGAFAERRSATGPFMLLTSWHRRSADCTPSSCHAARSSSSSVAPSTPSLLARSARPATKRRWMAATVRDHHHHEEAAAHSYSHPHHQAHHGAPTWHSAAVRESPHARATHITRPSTTRGAPLRGLACAHSHYNASSQKDPGSVRPSLSWSVS